YITCAEYTHFYGGKKPDIAQTDFRRLPFDHCSLSLQPFVYPVCTPEGVVFDLLNIVPWLKKYGTNPSNGEKLDGRCLIKLNFAKNSEGKYHCPVLFTVFTNNSHIVAIRTTGNVYAHEDPTSLDKFNVSNFFHVKNNMKIIDPDEEKAKQDPSYYLKNTNTETRETLQELYKEFKGDEVLAATMKVPEKTKVDRLNAAHYSTGKVSASFTSTAMTPKTCENFIKLCKKQYYDGTLFHRSIRNFVIQGGDPTGTGTGGESYWGKPFRDDFITFRSCAYLDKKHTIFGRVVGGFDTLTAMENVESDPKTDRPKVCAWEHGGCSSGLALGGP
ncbi:hypothetical protein E2I00_016170, partial [Balaenoptera physalus]